MEEDSSRRGSQQDDSEDESEILEESPCGRYLKRREEVERRNISGIDATFMAMDTEEGVEVVWNEVNLPNWDIKESKVREEKIKRSLDQLLQLDHPNIVKLHKYWMDIREDRARVIFITEYMSSGSLKQFLRKTKSNDIKLSKPAWRRWCNQLLSALCYMHSSSPPIIHGSLCCDSLSISHTGLIKVDAIAPSVLLRSLRWTAGMSNGSTSPSSISHFTAPELHHLKETALCIVAPFPAPLTASMDIFSFGMCALEMAVLEIDTQESKEGLPPTQDHVWKTLESLEDEAQRDFIRSCLSPLPFRRPSARKLLFHKVLFEVPSLRLLAAHVVVNTPSYQPEQLTEEALQQPLYSLPADHVLAEVLTYTPSPPSSASSPEEGHPPISSPPSTINGPPSASCSPPPLIPLLPTTHPPPPPPPQPLLPSIPGDGPDPLVFPESEPPSLPHIDVTEDPLLTNVPITIPNADYLLPQDPLLPDPLQSMPIRSGSSTNSNPHRDGDGEINPEIDVPPESVCSETPIEDDEPVSLPHCGRVLNLIRVSDRQADGTRNCLEKFLEEVRNGAYPLTALVPTYRPPIVSRYRTSPDLSDSPEAYEEEPRRILSLECDIIRCMDSSCIGINLLMRMDDRMNRQITCEHHVGDSPSKLVDELVHFGMINGDDRDTVKNAIHSKLELQDPCLPIPMMEPSSS